MSNKTREQLRKYLYADQDGICELCGERMLAAHEVKNNDDYQNMATIDHILRKRHGGDDHLLNVRAVHFKCNVARN